MLLDEFMPIYDFHEVHSIVVHAPPSRTFCAVKELSVSELSPLVHALFALRALPARLRGYRGRQLAGARPVVEQVVGRGFILLAEAPECELVLGTIGQFWKLTGSSSPRLANAQAFLAFDQPAYAKATLNFYVASQAEDRVTLSTETRIQASNPLTRKQFARYWGLIYAGSALIRIMWLKAIKRRAQQDEVGAFTKDQTVK